MLYNQLNIVGTHSLVGKTCIVTGASEGIGEAIARVLAVDGGANVVLASRQLDKLKKHIDKLSKHIAKSKLLAVQCDVTKLEDVLHLAASTIEKFGQIDILVNCAGCMYYCMVKNGYTEVNNFNIDAINEIDI